MLRRLNDRKRSSSRTHNTKRNKVGRSISVETLQDRTLMAADFGGFGDFIGPQMPSTEAVAAEVSYAATTETNATAENPLEITRRQGQTVLVSFNNGVVTITGRDDNDVVNVDFNQRTGDLDIVSQSYDRFGQQLGHIRARIDWNLVTEIRSNLNNGNDEFNAEGAYRPVVVDGGAGNDTLIGGSRADILRGNSGNDTLKGLAGDDVLDGAGNDDVIYGGLDDDTITGGNGNDVLYGEHGEDAIYGEAGNDRIFGGTWNDFLSGGDGNDFMSGGGSNDIMHGDDGDDTMHGNEGNDTIVGWNGNDWMYGGDGNDEMYGKSGTDRLYGGDGDDTLDGGDDGKRDVLFGQLGRDTFVRHTHWFSADDPDEFADYLFGIDRIIKR